MSYTANDQILDLSGVTADAQSEAVEMLNIYGFSVQIVWTSTTATATIQIEVSNDGITWIPLASPTQAIANDNGSVMFNVADSFYKFMRVDVDSVTGTITTLSALYNGKGV